MYVCVVQVQGTFEERKGEVRPRHEEVLGSK